MPSVSQYWPSGFYGAMNKSLAWLFARQTGQIGNWVADAVLTQGATTLAQTPEPSSGLIQCGILSETNFETGVTLAGVQAAPFAQSQIENITFALPPGLYPDNQLSADGYPINTSPVPLAWGPLLVNSYEVTAAMIAAVNYELFDPNHTGIITPGNPQIGGVISKWQPGAGYQFGQIIVDGNSNVQMALISGLTNGPGTGNYNGQPPNWPTTLGALTGDYLQEWKLVALGFANAGWLALGYCFNLLNPLSYYRVDVFSYTDAFYYQGSSSLYPTALGNGIPNAGTFSVASVAQGMIFAALYPASVPAPAIGWHGAQVPAGWVSHTNMGLGYKLAGYKAQVYVKTDVEYLQEDNIPIMVDADEAHARTGSSVVAAPGTPTVHILYDDPTSGWTEVYSSLQTSAAFEAMPRSFDIPTSDPLYVQNPGLTNVALLQNRSFIYDCALAMLAYCGAGNFIAAAKVIKQLNYFLDNPGYLASLVLENGEDNNSASRWTKSNGADSVSDVNDPLQPPYGTGLVVDFHSTTANDSFTYSGAGFPDATDAMLSFQHKEAGAVGFVFDISVTTSGGKVTDIQVTSATPAPASYSATTKIITIAIGPGESTYRSELLNLESLISNLATDTLASITGFKITLPAAGDLYFDNFSVGGLQPSNSLAFSYDVYNGQIDEAYIRAGAMAWVVYAYCVYMQASGDFSPVLYAQRMINFLLTLQSSAVDDTDGLFYLGWGAYKDPGYQFVPGLQLSVSTEHQADLWFAFSRAINLFPTAATQLLKTGQITTAQATSLNATAAALTTIISTIWINLLAKLYIAPNGGIPGHFAQGASSAGLDVSEALDASGHWSALLADANGRDDIALQCVEFFYSTFLLQNQQILKSSISNSYNRSYQITTPFSGFKPYNDSAGGYSGSPASVWQEGTWGAILALLRLYSVSGVAAYFAGLGTKIDAVLNALIASQQAILQATGNGSLLGYSLASRALPYEFEVWPFTAATAWMWLVSTNPSLLLSVNTLPQVLPNLMIPPGQNQTINDQQGSSSVGRFSVNCIDPTGALKSLAAQQDLIGQTAVLSMGFPGLAVGDFVPLHTVQIADAGSDQRGRVRISCADVQRYYAGAGAWANGGPSAYLPGQKGTPQPVGASWLSNAFPVSSDNPRWLQGNPIDLLLALLQNELGVGQDPALVPILSGTGGAQGLSTINPFWQKYLPGQDATLISPNQYIDVPGFLALRDGMFSGDWFEFKLTSAMQAKSWMEEYILRPLGLVTIVHANGLIGLKAMKNPVGLAPVASLTSRNIIGIPQVSREPIVNVLTVRMDVDDSSPQTASRQYNNEVVYEQSTSVYTYRRIANQQVEATGLRSARGGFLRAFILSDRTFRRYSFGTPKYSVDAFLSALQIELGDYVSLSHSLLPDLKTGNVGVSNVLCEVIGRQPDYANGRIKLDLLDTRFMNLTAPFEVAPLADNLPVWSSATDAEREQYMYISSAAGGGVNADGSPGNTIF